MIKINDITFSYKRKSKPVFQDFSLALPRGCVYGLLGKNGTGKTTLLNLMSGLLTPKSGSVDFNGVNVRRRLPSTLCDIFFVPEEFSLPGISLDKFVKSNSVFYPRFSNEDLTSHLATFDMNRDLNLGALSMGQRKKAYMSFALACNTSLLIMDEPTNGLDIPGKSAFRRFIASNMTDERTIVISTHQVRDIDRLLDHVAIIDNEGVLLNQPINEVTSRLCFKTTSRKEEAGSALHSRPNLAGWDIITINTTDDETQLNLETLFELATTKPELIQQLFFKP